MSKTPKQLRAAALAACAAFLAFVFAGHAQALEPVNKTFFGGLAAGGYDVVAYFTDGKPVEGSAANETEWNDATWRFATAEHRKAFLESPEKYAPQFGGYCAWAVSQGYTANGDPQFWKVVGGKLYLNYNAEVQRKWEADIPGLVARADANWPKLLAEK